MKTNDDNERHLKYKEVLKELSNERIGETYNIGKEIDFNHLTYRFKYCFNEFYQN